MSIYLAHDHLQRNERYKIYGLTSNPVLKNVPHYKTRIEKY